MPVCGVEMRNAAVAPFPAPLRRSPVAIGRTPHEQIGSGTPTSTARRIPEKPELPPMTRFTHALGIHTAMTPAARKPTTSHGDIAANTSANKISKLHIVFIKSRLPMPSLRSSQSASVNVFIIIPYPRMVFNRLGLMRLTASFLVAKS